MQTVVDSYVLCVEVLWQSAGVLWWFADERCLLQLVLPPSAEKCHRCSEPGSPRGNQKVGRLSCLTVAFASYAPSAITEPFSFCTFLMHMPSDGPTEVCRYFSVALFGNSVTPVCFPPFHSDFSWLQRSVVINTIFLQILRLWPSLSGEARGLQRAGPGQRLRQRQLCLQ